ncbi:MAG: class I SAM-dependent methyltransferase, partial [Actinobacteria bacterium]|nr:class I SAM-dependent methyltransferase [Actinomycetota bacterium]
RRVAGGSPVEVVCAEYSPRTQLRVLGVAPEELAGPVLDLGAGAHGRLVALLRGTGVDAIGVDRYSRVPHVLPGDWLSAPFAPGSWGTVISHLGFSLHFLHHHRAGDAVDFARAYMRILRALVPGGRFVYAPSLPFIEDLLGSEWEVRRVQREVEGVRVSATSVRRRDG